jgi:FkbM family methyltransferase
VADRLIRRPPPGEGSKITLLETLRRKLNKPYFVFRPSQAIHRAVLPLRRRRARGAFGEVMLPWGLPLTFRAHDTTGLCYLTRGVYDLAVCETLWRLSEPGELALDIGAHIGQMTSVLATRLGPRGRVIAVEPHPETFRLLSTNVKGWAEDRIATIDLWQIALSSRSGVGKLTVWSDFNWDTAVASLLREDAPTHGTAKTVDVPVARLDEKLPEENAGVMKLDVEGCELEVLQGAERLLAAQRIRDIVFEEWHSPPTPVTELLEGFGYTLFALDQRLLGPVLAPGALGAARRSGEAPSYVATVAPTRATQRLASRGWGVFGVGPAGRLPSLAVRGAG